MKKNVEFIGLALIFIFGIISCAIQPDVPVVFSSTVTTTTTTTVRAPVIVVTQTPPSTTTTTTTTTTTIALPSVSEAELRNLYGEANMGYEEASAYEIEALLPEQSGKTFEKFQNAKAYYEAEICRLPFDGASAYPVATMLRAASESLDSLLAAGLPMRSEAEKANASTQSAFARSRDAAIEASDRFDEAVSETIAAADLHNDANYRGAIAAYKRASILYESAGIKAETEALRARVLENDYGLYSPYHSEEAERLRNEEIALYAAATNDSIREGVAKLKIAARDYTQLLTWGAKQRALEARALALVAKRAADVSKAETSASDAYATAAASFAEGERLSEAGDFLSAAPCFRKAAEAFESAHVAAAAADSSASAARVEAKLAADKALAEAKLLAEKAEANRLAAERLAAKDEEIARLNAKISIADRTLAEAQNRLTESELQLADAARLAAALLSSEIDAIKKSVRIDLDQNAFSPNGDGVKDTLAIRIPLPFCPAIATREIAIYALDASDKLQPYPVKKWSVSKESGDSYAWDGSIDSGDIAPDGTYQVKLTLTFTNGEMFSLASPRIILDTSKPAISVSADPLLFSPNGDGNKDFIIITQSTSLGDDWTGRIKDASGATVRTWLWKSEAKSFTWDGKDSTGAIVRDGTYRYEVSSTDIAGNTAAAEIPEIRLNATKPNVKVASSKAGISLDADSRGKNVIFNIAADQSEGIESWKFTLIDGQGAEKRSFGGLGSDMPTSLAWDGRDSNGKVTQGQYIGKLIVTYAKGDVVQASSEPVFVEIGPPTASIKTNPTYFSPDGDGVDDKFSFSINVSAAVDIVDWKLEVLETAVVESKNQNAAKPERLFIEWNGKGKPPATIVWDGKSSRGELVESASEYPFKFTVRDSLGKSATTSGIITVDVLVIVDGDQLKIKVPSIEFRANYADFGDLSPDIVARNEAVVARIAQILNRFPDYRIKIEGHANSVSKMHGYSQAKIQSEESKELIPLSTARAAMVRAMLIKNGIDIKRVSIEGLGSSQPVVSFLDVENRWKNRRVEFVLIKKK